MSYYRRLCLISHNDSMICGRCDEFMSVQVVDTGVVRTYWFNVSHIPEDMIYVAREYNIHDREWKIVDRGLWERLEDGETEFKFGKLLLSETKPATYIVKKDVDDTEYVELTEEEYGCYCEMKARCYTINEVHPAYTG